MTTLVYLIVDAYNKLKFTFRRTSEKRRRKTEHRIAKKIFFCWNKKNYLTTILTAILFCSIIKSSA